MATKYLVSVDPGDKNNGFCFFTYDTETKRANTKIMSVLDDKGLDDYLKMIWGMVFSKDPDAKPDISFVVENFRVDMHVREKSKAVYQWNEVITIRNIGKVQMVANWLGTKAVLQEPGNVLPMARKWGPWQKLPKHIPDDKSAWLHGAHFMMNVRWIKTCDQIALMGQERLV